MAFTEEEIAEFKAEALELLDAAERSLLALDQGGSLDYQYANLFRVYHSLKGAAGMMEMAPLQSHMHQLETLLVEEKKKGKLENSVIDFFLRGTDAARKILGGQTTHFEFNLGSSVPSEASRPVLVDPSPPPVGRVIVVDDEPELVEILTSLLESAGLEVRGFTAPNSVLDEIASFQPDVILSDIVMPGMDGMELLRRIRETHVDLPVIFLSGNVSKEYLMTAIRLNVYAVLEKPFQTLHVIETCLNATKRHQLSRLLNRSINLIMYQYSDLDAYLAKSGLEDVRKTVRNEIAMMVQERNLLRSPPNKKG